MDKLKPMKYFQTKSDFLDNFLLFGSLCWVSLNVSATEWCCSIVCSSGFFHNYPSQISCSLGCKSSSLPQAIHYGGNFVSFPNIINFFLSQLKQYFDDDFIWFIGHFYFAKKQSSPLIWHCVVSVKSTVKISSIFVAFLENMNFNRK